VDRPRLDAGTFGIQEIGRNAFVHRQVLSQDMAFNKRLDHQSLSIELSHSHKEGLRKKLDLVGLASEEWLLDFICLLRDVRRFEREKREGDHVASTPSASSYADTFETGSMESEVSSRVSVDRRSMNPFKSWDRNRSLFQSESGLANTICILQSLRKISLEVLTEGCLATNVIAASDESLTEYFSWCMDKELSVLQTMLNFEQFTPSKRLPHKGATDRYQDFLNFRSALVGRILDEKYLYFDDLMIAARDGTIPFDEIEQTLNEDFGKRGALNLLLRDLQIISFRSQGLTLQVIADRLSLSRERIRQVLKRYVGSKVDVSDQFFKVRDLKLALSQKLRADTDGGTVRLTVAKKIVESIAKQPGVAIGEMAEQLGVTYEECLRCTPIPLRKFFASNFDQVGSKVWSDEYILETLKLAATFAYPLSANDYVTLRRQGAFIGPSAVLINTRFGNWSKACEAAGIASGSRRKREYDRTWSNDDLWNIVMKFFLDPKTGGTLHNFETWLATSDLAYPSRANFRLRLGSWTMIRSEIFRRLRTDDYGGLFRSYCEQVEFVQEGAS
jgi:hypothetical protein